MRRFIEILGLVTWANAAWAQGDWPQWRGPAGDGVSHEKGWVARFGEQGPKKLWDAKVGRGFSSPVVRDGLLYLLSSDPRNSQRETVWCFDAATGAERWKHAYDIKSVQRGQNPSGGTPAVVGGFVYSYGAAMTLIALDAKTGVPAWTRDVVAELSGRPVPYGYQLSPLPFENLIIVPAILDKRGAKGPAFEPRAGPYPVTGGVLLAFDRESGKEKWRNTEGASAWSSPVLADLDGKKTLVHLTGRYLLGIDPSTGTTRWKRDLRDVGIEAEDMAAAPVIHGDIVVVPIHKAYGSTTSGTAGSAAFRIKDDKPTLLWKNKEWCHWFQPAAVWQGAVYAFDEKSTFWCLDVETGKAKWRSKDLGLSGKGGGAFMIADGKILAIDARHHLTVAEVSQNGHAVLGKAVVFGGEPGFECETAPVLVGGRLYCRNHTQLVCFDLRAQ